MKNLALKLFVVFSLAFALMVLMNLLIPKVALTRPPGCWGECTDGSGVKCSCEGTQCYCNSAGCDGAVYCMCFDTGCANMGICWPCGPVGEIP
jgi:hypothetical protein